jgi:hypothetical protein
MDESKLLLPARASGRGLGPDYCGPTISKALVHLFAP